jgi:hypothetical protein
MRVDKTIAKKFVAALTGDENIAIRLKFIPDSPQAKADKLPVEEGFGSIDELWEQVIRAQRCGYGVYTFVQTMKPVHGYATGRDVDGFRAHFGDLDKGSPAAWHRQPDILVHSSTVNGVKKLQPWWLIGPTEEKVWRSNQARLLRHYDDDQSVKDTVRVGRLPGSLHLKGEPQLVTFERFCDEDIYSLLPTSDEVVSGTAEPKQKQPSNNSASTETSQHHPENIRKMLAFADCDKRNDYDTWVAYLKLLFDGSINWTEKPTNEWLMETAIAYSNGDLKRQYVDPNYAGPSTFKPDETPAQIADIRDKIDPNYTGQKITVRSLYAEAVDNGYMRQFDDTPMSKKFGKYKSEAKAANDDDEEDGPANIFEQAVPTDPVDIDPDMLPPTIAEYAIDNAERLGVSLSMVAMPALVACAACTHDDYRLQPRAHETKWTEPARLWAIVIDRPSGAKSPAADAALKPLHTIDADWTDKFNKEYAVYQTTKEKYDADRKAFKQDYDDLIGGTAPEEPIKRRLVTNDFTMEGLKAVLANNPAGVLVWANEIASVFGSLNQYKGGKGADRQLLVELNDGGRRVVDRKGSGELVIPNWGVSVYGTIQPGTLRAIVNGRMLIEDGLLQRFFPFFGQTIGVGVDRVPDPQAEKIYTDTLYRLANKLPRPTGPIISILDPAARELWNEIEQFRWTTYSNDNMHEGLGAFLGKFPKYFARLIMTYHAIECVTRTAFAAPCCMIERRVSLETVQRAHNLLTNFILPQGQLVYARLFSPLELDAQWIGKHILTTSANKITLRELRRYKRSFERNEELALSAMAYLRKRGWVEEAKEAEAGNGSTSYMWPVKPKVHTKFADMVPGFRAEKREVG